MGGGLELEHNEHWMCLSMIQGIYRAIAKQNETCMTFPDGSFQVVASLGTKFLSKRYTSNKLLITRSGKCGIRRKKKTDHND